MNLLENWSKLADIGVKVVALECHKIDRSLLFNFFVQEAKQRTLPLYYWNVGFNQVKSARINSGKCQLFDTEFNLNESEILSWLLNSPSAGIFLLDDLVDFEGLETRERIVREAQLQNIFEQYQHQKTASYLVLMGEYIQFSNRLKGIEILKYSLPDEQEVKSIIEQFCDSRELALDSPELRHRLAVVCQGLPRGEIKTILPRYAALNGDLITTIEAILTYKIHQWRGLGLEFIAEADVTTAGGLDLLQQFLQEKVVKLNEPSARYYKLRPPRGMLLLGPPGTGKTLSAKLAAKALGYSLLGLSWGNILGAENPDRMLAVATCKQERLCSQTRDFSAQINCK